MNLLTAFSMTFMTNSKIIVHARVHTLNVAHIIFFLLFLSNRWTNLFYFPNVRLISEYSTYAKIEITKNGYRHLSLKGYTYGETKVSDRSVYWRCTANLKDATGKSKRCVTHVVTEVRNGWFLIHTLFKNENHARSLSIFFSLSLSPKIPTFYTHN